MALPLWEKEDWITRVNNEAAIDCPHCQMIIPCRRDSRHRDTQKDVAFLGLSGLCLMTPFAQMSTMVLLLVGCYLLLRGIMTRSCKRLVPGGLLGGIGLGLVLTAGPFHLVTGDTEGSLFLFACALGLFVTFILSRRFTHHPQWWSIIPGSMLALTSLFLLF